MMPLQDYRVLDLSRLLPGPVATHILADLGMDVIKVEEPVARPGMGRDVLTPGDPTPEQEVRYAAYNGLARNKKSIAINLRNDKGREVLYRMVGSADAFIEGYRPGVMKSLGCDYETLSKINPRLVYCSISAYGQDGPFAMMPGHEDNCCAMAGQLALQRDEAGVPGANSTSMADMAGGVHAAIGILAALMAREKTGRGQYVDVTLTHSLLTWMITAISTYGREGLQSRQQSSLTALARLKCKDGKYVTTLNTEDHFWVNFCNALGRPDFIPLHHRTGENLQQFEQMTKEVRSIMLTKTRDEWFDILAKADTCVAPVLELDELLEHPLHKQRGAVLELEHPTEGKVRQVGEVIKFSEMPFEFRNFAPVLGEHTAQLLQEVGYSSKEIQDLANSGAVKAWKILPNA